MIDTDGYRLNVGIILLNQDSKVLWAKRVGQEAWQFPQGGLKAHETPEQALYRELNEEIGLTNKHVKLLGSTRQWLRYRLPPHLIRHYQKPLCIGQKQKWFLLQLTASDNEIRLNNGDTPEFEKWYWVDFWYPLQEVVYFKRKVYENALQELEPLAKKANVKANPSNPTKLNFQAKYTFAKSLQK